MIYPMISDCGHKFDMERDPNRPPQRVTCPRCRSFDKTTPCKAVQNWREKLGHREEGQGIFEWRNHRSKAMGILKKHIPAMMKKYPHHIYDPKNGDMLFTSAAHFKQCLKDIRDSQGNRMVDFKSFG